MVYYDQLRYRLMPYIYTLAGKTYFDDYTIMRALVMDFANDKNTHDISDQYMFGPSFMVCPVHEYKARSREVYFPANSNWYDFESNKYISGGQTLQISAPYERIPLFVREGSIVPMGRIIQNTKESQADNLTINVYTGANGEFTIYEDEGTNYNYEKGSYATIKMSYDEASRTLSIGAINGGYNGMPKERKLTIVFISKDSKSTKTTINYTGEATSVATPA